MYFCKDSKSSAVTMGVKYFLHPHLFICTYSGALSINSALLR